MDETGNNRKVEKLSNGEQNNLHILLILLGKLNQ